MHLKVLPSECECEQCKSMCRGPCCGDIKDIEKIIDAGYGNRLMLDDWPDPSGCGDILKPALKGYEGEKAPYTTRSSGGCTFFIGGKCELHDKNLKPIQGKLYHHALSDKEFYSIDEYIRNSWKGPLSKKVIQKWKMQMKPNKTPLPSICDECSEKEKECNFDYKDRKWKCDRCK